MAEEDYPKDPLIGLVADIDQMIATAPHLARAARGLFDAYKEEGFDDRQATLLTIASIWTERPIS